MRCDTRSISCEAAQSDIYKKSSLDLAMRDTFRKARRFLMTAKGLSEDEAISLMSAAHRARCDRVDRHDRTRCG